MGDRMVPRMMSEGAGGMIKRWVRKQGRQGLTSSRGRGDREERDASAVALSNGVTVDADLVISATGVKPNIGFLQGSPALPARTAW